jgi:hypothetical protein
MRAVFTLDKQGSVKLSPHSLTYGAGLCFAAALVLTLILQWLTYNAPATGETRNKETVASFSQSKTSRAFSFAVWSARVRSLFASHSSVPFQRPPRHVSPFRLGLAQWEIAGLGRCSDLPQTARGAGLRSKASAPPRYLWL